MKSPNAFSDSTDPLSARAYSMAEESWQRSLQSIENELRYESVTFFCV